MIKQRVYYFIFLIATIILGLASRHFKVIPLFVGDILWATMVYFIMRLLFINKPVKFVALVSLLFSFAIEFGQLYKAPWIDSIRATLFGRMVLGSTFNWGDLLSYIVGVCIGVLINYILTKKPNSTEQGL
ncbi:MAG: DUF2809 domain-containing protein [Mucilaginibacter sp.]